MLLYKAFGEQEPPIEETEEKVNVVDGERNIVAERPIESIQEVPEEHNDHVVPGIPRLRTRERIRRPTRYND